MAQLRAALHMSRARVLHARARMYTSTPALSPPVLPPLHSPSCAAPPALPLRACTHFALPCCSKSFSALTSTSFSMPCISAMHMRGRKLISAHNGRRGWIKAAGSRRDFCSLGSSISAMRKRADGHWAQGQTRAGGRKWQLGAGTTRVT